MLALKLRLYIGPAVAVILAAPLLAPTFFISPPYSSTLVFIVMCLAMALAGSFYEIVFSLFRESLAAFKRFALFSGIFWSTLLPPIKYVHNILLETFLSYPTAPATLAYVVVLASSGFIFGLMFSVVYRYISAFTRP